jgi:two-component system chemotaxis response regulator CheV
MSTPLNTKTAPSSSHTADSKFQLLLFRLGDSAGSGRSELFGINVFKVREIVVAPEITSIVNAPAHAMGLANVRGQLIPVIDLPALSGCVPKTNSKIVLVTEFARTTQAFLVDEVVEIIQLDWKHLLAADNNSSGLLSGVARIDGDVADSRLAQVLDVEQIIRNVFPNSQTDSANSNIQKIKLPEGTSILFADDSAIARMLVEESLKTMGVAYSAVNPQRCRQPWQARQRQGGTGADRPGNAGDGWLHPHPQHQERQPLCGHSGHRVLVAHR